ncbi:hypothetical protein, partial [Leucobacter sp. M11]|uniref:hypothetical protein n=1 Tax=Leucobacter sp. M11 TaxID=2993565 RepID=UPI002D7EF4C9
SRAGQIALVLFWVGVGILALPPLLFLTITIGTAGVEAIGWALFLGFILFTTAFAPVTLGVFALALVFALIARGRVVRPGTRRLGLAPIIGSALGAALSLAVVGVQFLSER